MRKIVTLWLGVLMFWASGAQERNMARLGLVDTSFVDVSMGMEMETGSLKDLYAPETLVRGVLDATSRQKIGQVSLYGHFGYGYGYGWGSTWRGWIDPSETPFMLADSIPGTISLEKYALEAGAAVPLGGGWTAGIDAAYTVSLMAKHKDLRNKNTGMIFRVAPGVMWQGRRFGIGLDAGYERGTERVEYAQISENVEQVLFELYGLWLYHASGYASAETRRFKENDRYHAGLQLDFRSGSVRLHNDLRAEWLQGIQTEVGYNNLRHGDVRSLTWSDVFSVKIGTAHEIEAAARFSTMQGFRPLQRQELDPDSRIRVWVSYGDPVFCYWRQYHQEQVHYTYGTSWRLTLGAENWGMQHSYTEYPQRFSQRLGCLTPTVAASIPAGCFEVAPRIGFAKVYGAESGESQWQLAEPLQQQWDYWTCDKILADLQVKWTQASGRWGLVARYGLEALPWSSATPSESPRNGRADS